MIKLYCSQALELSARQLSVENGFTFGSVINDIKSLNEGHVLFLNEHGLSLCQTGRKASGPVRCDFVTGRAKHRRLYGGGKSQLIAKAIGIKGKVRPSVADLNAGLGNDAFVFASLGCRVTMLERNAIVAALLNDGLARARQASDGEGELAEILDRIVLERANAADWLSKLPESRLPDVIYLDPMFPERKKSALVGKNMQALQRIVGEDEDAGDLLPLALSRAIHRVVVKRPRHAPWLNNQKPALSQEGKSVRFDIYPVSAMQPSI